MTRVIDGALRHEAKLREDATAPPVPPEGMDNAVIFSPPCAEDAALSHVGNNGLAKAFMLAYNKHLCLRLSPDGLWLAIVQAVSTWVNDEPGRAEKYRGVFVTHVGVEKLDVSVPRAWERDRSLVEWENVLHILRDMAAARVTPGIVAAFEPQFSTTTPASVTACVVTALHAVKEFFAYSMTTRCGIGEVVLEGEAADWAMLRARATNLCRVLGEVGTLLAPWFAQLDGTLAELAATAAGAPPRTEFWEHAYSETKPRGSMDVQKLSGWFLHFFCADETPKESVKISELPAGFVTVPFKWVKLDRSEEHMLLCSGMWKTYVDKTGAVFCKPQWMFLSAKTPTDGAA
jgi:hypothetical protein